MVELPPAAVPEDGGAVEARHIRRYPWLCGEDRLPMNVSATALDPGVARRRVERIVVAQHVLERVDVFGPRRYRAVDGLPRRYYDLRAGVGYDVPPVGRALLLVARDQHGA